MDSRARRKREAWARKGGTDAYVREMGPYALQRDERIVRAMLGRGPGRLLDIPCGTGRYLELERELGFEVVAADFSPTMLAAAPRLPGVSFVRADIFNHPFPRQSFDVILVSRLLFHYANPERILSSILQALKPDGRVVFDVLNTWSTRWAASQLLRLTQRDPARRLYYEDPRLFGRKLAALGLEAVDRKSAYLLPTRFYRFLPRPVIAAAEALEMVIPARLRVVTFWQVRRAPRG